VTHWLRLLEAGDAAAAQPLLQRYFRRLVELARAHLHATPCGMADEEDVALSAFDSFCRRAQDGRFPELNDRNNLWALLVKITLRKAIDLRQHETRLKRPAGAGRSATDPDVLISAGPTPEFAAQMADECRWLLGLLDDDLMRSVAVWKMEGYTVEEIAARLGCIKRTVERKLKIIRAIWSRRDGS
jgi:DNA-directed RNA polymerase specialized sigma24 family protein